MMVREIVAPPPGAGARPTTSCRPPAVAPDSVMLLPPAIMSEPAPAVVFPAVFPPTLIW